MAKQEAWSLTSLPPYPFPKGFFEPRQGAPFPEWCRDTPKDLGDAPLLSQAHPTKNQWQGVTPPVAAPAVPRPCLGAEGDPINPQSQCISFWRLPSTRVGGAGVLRPKGLVSRGGGLQLPEAPRAGLLLQLAQGRPCSVR